MPSRVRLDVKDVLRHFQALEDPRGEKVSGTVIDPRVAVS